jgi:hypothetical protein
MSNKLTLAQLVAIENEKIATEKQMAEKFRRENRKRELELCKEHIDEIKACLTPFINKKKISVSIREWAGAVSIEIKQLWGFCCSDYYTSSYIQPTATGNFLLCTNNSFKNTLECSAEDLAKRISKFYENEQVSSSFNWNVPKN